MKNKAQEAFELSGSLTLALAELQIASEGFSQACFRWEDAAEAARYPEHLQEVGEDHQIVEMSALVHELQQARAAHDHARTKLIVEAQNVVAAWKRLKLNQSIFIEDQK